MHRCGRVHPTLRVFSCGGAFDDVDRSLQGDALVSFGCVHVLAVLFRDAVHTQKVGLVDLLWGGPFGFDRGVVRIGIWWSVSVARICPMERDQLSRWF